MYAVLMLLAATSQTLSMTQHNQRMYIVGMRIRTALISAIYRKVCSVEIHFCIAQIIECVLRNFYIVFLILGFTSFKCPQKGIDTW